MTRILISLLFFVLLAAPGEVALAQSCTTNAQCATGQRCVANDCVDDVNPPNLDDRPDDINPPNPERPGSGRLTNPIRVDSLQELLQIVLEAVVQIGSIILVLALVYVGFLFVVAQGNEEKITNAKNALLWTIIGGLILLGASAIGAVIGSTVETFRA